MFFSKKIITVLLLSCISNNILFTEPEQISNTSEQPTTEQVSGATETDANRIYNSTTSIYIIQGTDEIDSIIEKINSLKTSQSPQVLEIQQTRYRYNALTMAQKARVTNENLLYELEQTAHITYDYNQIYANYGTNTDDLSDSMSKGTSYTFELKKDTSISISIKYTMDNNMDGIMDTPVISLKTPDNNILQLSTENTELHDANMNIKLTWADGFSQMDIASGQEGKWTILTSEPVVFMQMDYAGSKQDIAEIPEVDIPETGTETDVHSKTTTSAMFNLITRIIIMIIVVVMLIILPKIIAKQKNGKKNNINQKQISPKEESAEDILKELQAIINTEDFSDKTTNNNEDIQENPKKEISFSQEEINDAVDNGGDDSGILFWTGEGNPTDPKNIPDDPHVASEQEKTDYGFDDDFFDF
ncbi:hypothetical protein DW920_13160 [Clostridium sp. AM42-36]|jgi:hypothetical protein|nr:hypothetical protein DW920_13160 [Clostridium sp. AM42-36]